MVVVTFSMLERDFTFHLGNSYRAVQILCNDSGASGYDHVCLKCKRMGRW